MQIFFNESLTIISFKMKSVRGFHYFVSVRAAASFSYMPG